MSPLDCGCWVEYSENIMEITVTLRNMQFMHEQEVHETGCYELRMSFSSFSAYETLDHASEGRRYGFQNPGG